MRAGPPGETWLGVHEASVMLGVSPATLRRWCVAGDVAAFTTPGGHRRFPLSGLQALLPRDAAGSAGEPARVGRLLADALARHADAADAAEASAALERVEELASEHVRLALRAALGAER